MGSPGSMRVIDYDNYAGVPHFWMNLLFAEENLLVAEDDPKDDARDDCQARCEKLQLIPTWPHVG